MSTYADVGKKDYSGELTTIISESISICDLKGIDEALNILINFEKKCRIDNDFTTLKEVCLHMIRLCREKSTWSQICSTLTLLSKRRAQHKTAISAIVKEGIEYIDSSPNEDSRKELIITLKDICSGKMYVEAEDARLHLMLAKMYEKEGDIGKACDEIQDVHVETYGSLSKKEKSEYILEQMRMNLIRQDWVRMLIQSRKMNLKILEEDELQSTKIKYYTMMVDYYTQEKNPWEISQCYYKIYNTQETKDNEETLNDSLTSCIIFLILSKYDNHQSDMMHRLKLLKDVEKLDTFKSVLTLLTTMEIVPSPFPQQVELEIHPSLSRGPCANEETETYFKSLIQQRILQHNLRVIAKYYKQVHTSRLCQMLSLDDFTLETELSEMSRAADAYVKINRPEGIVSFEKPRNPEEVLSDWSSDISKMLGLMESTSHLINREIMVHKAKKV